MSQQYHTPERQENSDAAQPRYGTNMNMTVGTRSEDPPVCDRKIADPTRDCCRNYKSGDENKNLHDLLFMLLTWS